MRNSAFVYGDFGQPSFFSVRLTNQGRASPKTEAAQKRNFSFSTILNEVGNALRMHLPVTKGFREKFDRFGFHSAKAHVFIPT